DLGNNDFSGSIPKELNKGFKYVSVMFSFTHTLNPLTPSKKLEGNHLSGKVPENLLGREENFSMLKVFLNNNCFVESDFPSNRFSKYGTQKSQSECEPFLQQQPSPSKPIALIAGLTVAAVIAVALIIGAVVVVKRKRTSEKARSFQNLEQNGEEVKEIKDKEGWRKA
ncbi:hypothetical protein HDU97_007649, partial [Phlyctochytrium planicorne]